MKEVRKAGYSDFEPVHGGSVVGGKLAGRIGEQELPGVPRTWMVDVFGLADAQGTQASIPVSSRQFRRHTKVLILRIGDRTTEQQALNPLAESLKSQLSLLMPPNEVDVEYIRTLAELAGALRVHGGGGAQLSARSASPWGYAVLVGHGRAGLDAGINFGDVWHSPEEIAAEIKSLGPGRKAFGDAVFVSACCETGSDTVARDLSDRLNTTFIGPGRTVHSFEAAGFVHRFFYEHLFAGFSAADALRRSRAATNSYETSFRLWQDGIEALPA